MSDPERAPEHEREEEADEEDPLLAAHARLDELEAAIASRDAEIASRRRALASPGADGATPMERHRARVRELEAELAEARRARDATRATLPAPKFEETLLVVICGVFLVGWVVLMITNGGQ